MNSTMGEELDYRFEVLEKEIDLLADHLMVEFEYEFDDSVKGLKRKEEV